mgnify:CR=1 FL=1
MRRRRIDFRDPVVERVVDKFVSRSDVGYEKYGVTLNNDKSNLFAWINHLQEELMDAVLYMQKLKETTTEELMDALATPLSKENEEELINTANEMFQGDEYTFCGHSFIKIDKHNEGF